MNPPPPDVVLVGAGLAGCEAALQIAGRGFKVRLIERKPASRSEASSSDAFAELVCSNSFRARTPLNAVGLLKEEMLKLGSAFMAAAMACEIPAGGALAVDRDRFSAWLTERVQCHEHIEVESREVDELPEEGEVLILASGPLTGGGLADSIASLAGSEQLHFYDAIAPIVEADSIDMQRAYFASRYDKGGADYLNLPMDKDEYLAFVDALNQAEKAPPRPFEKPRYFEGCLPIDLMAERGEKTLAFGPLKPVGLIDPHTGRRPHAVIQLRAENADKSAFSLVGFQTRLTHPEQLRVFRAIPGLENAVFQRLGSVHRNTFLDAPRLLDEQMRLKRDPRVVFAGQISGIEGYVESAASGLLVGLTTAARLKGAPLPPFPADSMLGGMVAYLMTEQKHFQPSNVTHAMLPALIDRPRAKKDRKTALADRARAALAAWLEASGLEILSFS